MGKGQACAGGGRERSTARHGSRAQDLTGRVFGRLLVLKRAENRNGKVRWVCRCDCGRETTCTAGNLRSGHVRSCGCLRGLNGKGYRDLTGLRFGRLLALERTGGRDYKGSLHWRCRCDCGRFCVVTEDALARGKTVSCGCRKEEVQKALGRQTGLYEGTSYTMLRYRTGARADNRSGCRGVRITRHGTYLAHIGFQGKRYHLGTWPTLPEALSARKEAEALLHEGFCDAYERWKAVSGGDPGWEAAHPLVYEVSFRNRTFTVFCNIGELEQMRSI